MVWVQGPAKFRMILTVLLAQLVFRKLKVLEPGQEVRRENPTSPVEGVAGEPDHFLLGESDGARMVELLTQLELVDLLGETNAQVAIDQREGGLHIGVETVDHLQHQQLVEVGIEQAADDRIELPRVVVDPSRNIGLRRHISSTSRDHAAFRHDPYQIWGHNL